LKVNRDGKAGRAVRAGPRPAAKNAGRTDLFNPLTCISPQPARVSSGAGRAGPLTRKKKNWHLAVARQHN